MILNFLNKIVSNSGFNSAGAGQTALSKPGFAGSFDSYSEALLSSSNPSGVYQDSTILQKTLDGTLQLKTKMESGQLSELADAKNLRLLGLISGLGILSNRGKGPIEVLDFGGAMGNHYFKIRPFLDRGLRLRWTVFDLPKTVQMARQHFLSRELAFVSDYHTLGSLRPLLILASSSLQYTPDPHRTLQRLQSLARGWLILDRMPFSPEKSSRILLQTVSPDYYDASYPVHLLQEAELLRLFKKPAWKLVLRWKDEEESIQVDGRLIGYQGMAFKKTAT